MDLGAEVFSGHFLTATELEKDAFGTTWCMFLNS